MKLAMKLGRNWGHENLGCVDEMKTGNGVYCSRCSWDPCLCGEWERKYPPVVRKPECNGICVMGWEVLEGYGGVVYPHPECELHSPCAGDDEIPEEPGIEIGEEPHSWSEEQ